MFFNGNYSGLSRNDLKSISYFFYSLGLSLSVNGDFLNKFWNCFLFIYITNISFSMKELNLSFHSFYFAKHFIFKINPPATNIHSLSLSFSLRVYIFDISLSILFLLGTLILHAILLFRDTFYFRGRNLPVGIINKIKVIPVFHFSINPAYSKRWQFSLVSATSRGSSAWGFYRRRR